MDGNWGSAGDEYSTVIKLLILIIHNFFFSVNRVGAFPGGSADWMAVVGHLPEMA